MVTPLPAKLHIVAFDHRAALWDALDIAGRVDRDAISTEVKGLIWRAFLAAHERGAAPSIGAILVDDQYAAVVADEAAAAGIPFGMPVEASPATTLTFTHGDAFGDALTAFNPSFAKVLVRCHPRSRPLAPDEIAVLAKLQLWCAQRKLPWMCEVITPRPPESAGIADFVEKVRPRLIVEAINYLKRLDVSPDIWKVEGCGSRQSLNEIALAARAGSPDALVIVLGQGADVAQVTRWLVAAAGVAGFAGFAVGRTIFGKPLIDYIASKIDANTAVERMAATYAELSNAYASASA